MKYTVKDGNKLVNFLKTSGFPNAQLIGSLSRNKSSYHDIDILIPIGKRTIKVQNELLELLIPKNGYEYTDWGGIFFKNTQFGNVDVFFTTKDINMNGEIKSKIEALKHAVYICESRKTSFKHVAYNVACDEIKLFLEAAISRLENGEDMQDYAYVQTQ